MVGPNNKGSITIIDTRFEDNIAVIVTSMKKEEEEEEEVEVEAVEPCTLIMAQVLQIPT